MPSCKYCGGRISRFDKDICPICGQSKPLQGVSSETVEITSNINLSNVDTSSYKPKNKFTLIVLFSLIGWIGAPMFYLGYVLQGVLSLLINLVLFGGIGSIFAFFTPIGILWGYIIAVIMCYVVNIALGIVTYLRHNLKDARGDLIK